ncbi:hypothetical protein [Thermococcus henrietii]|uniref:hypothetical protein n=1 Tax=Thermococcus henrietii TaxID=2016361 RepID=UPI001314F8AF|nr:hypothetical protein [Thermococcus henrietii]
MNIEKPVATAFLAVGVLFMSMVLVVSNRPFALRVALWIYGSMMTGVGIVLWKMEG